MHPISFLFRNNSILFIVPVSVLLKSNAELKSNTRRSTKYPYASSFFFAIIRIWLATWLCNHLISLNGDIPLYTKAYIALHKLGIICLSETYLDLNTASYDLEIPRYKLISSRHHFYQKCLCFLKNFFL